MTDRTFRDMLDQRVARSYIGGQLRDVAESDVALSTLHLAVGIQNKSQSNRRLSTDNEQSNANAGMKRVEQEVVVIHIIDVAVIGK